MLDSRTSFRCLCRAWLVGAALTTRGMQHLGLLYALNPGLEALYADPKKLAQARGRYLVHVNTHPFMAPLLTGFLLALETRVAQGSMPAENMHSLTQVTAAAFSAVGDSFFSGGLLAAWALSASLCVVLGLAPLAMCWTLFLFALLTVFRVWTFFLGLRRGMPALQWVRRMDLINWGDRLKPLNALLVVLLLWRVVSGTDPDHRWDIFFWSVVCLVCGTLLVDRAHIPRILLAAAAFGVLHLL